VCALLHTATVARRQYTRTSTTRGEWQAARLALSLSAAPPRHTTEFDSAPQPTKTFPKNRYRD